MVLHLFFFLFLSHNNIVTCNQIEENMNDTKNNLEIPILKELKEKNIPKYVSFLFFAFSLKREYPDIDKYSYFQFNNKIKIQKEKSPALQLSYQYLLKDSKLIEYFTQGLSPLLSLSLDDLSMLITSNIISFLERAKVIDYDIENLEKRFISAQLGSILILSPYVKNYLLEEKSSISSIVFNFYNDIINMLLSIFFDVKRINYFIFSSFKAERPGDLLFDNILIFPPYRNQVYLKQLVLPEKLSDTMSESFEWNFIDYFLKRRKDTGSLVAILQLGTLNKLADEPHRERLMKNKEISYIIELPKLALFSMPLALISFQKGKDEIKLINASKFAQNLRRGINLDSDKIVRAVNGQIEGALGVLTLDEAKENNFDFTPNRFFKNDQLDFVNPTPLKDLTTAIFRGFQIPSDMLDEYAVDKDTKIKILTLTDIEDGIIVRKNLQSLSAIDKKMEHYILEKGDLVISCKGKTFKTAVIDVPYGETYISTGSLIVIRPDENKLDSTFLKIFLDSHLGIEALKRIQTGTTVLSLNPSKLLTIVIPLPHLSKQILISSSYKYKLQGIKEVKDVVSDMKDEMNKKFDDNFIELLN